MECRDIMSNKSNQLATASALLFRNCLYTRAVIIGIT